MSSGDPRIRPIYVIFTPTITTITETLSIPSTTHLRIQVTPTHNGKNISLIKVWYFDPNSSPSRFSDEINSDDVFRSIPHSMSDTLPHDTLVEQISTYMKGIPPDEVSVIMKEYTKYIENGILLDGFIAGISSYLVFLLLNENSIFMNQMLFQLTLPCTIYDCNSVTRNMFQYLSLPLSALSRVSNGVLLQLVNFIQSFINIWEPAFSNGPSINNTNEAKVCMEVISGLANDATLKLSRIQSEHSSLVTSLSTLESRLKASINDSLLNMKREINNLLVETRSSVKDLVSHVSTQLDIVDSKINNASSVIDHTLKSRISNILETELDSQIKLKIRSCVEDTHDRIREIATHYTMSEGKKLVSEAVSERESQLRGTLTGLEHRVEILYDRFASGSVPDPALFYNNSPPSNHSPVEKITHTPPNAPRYNTSDIQHPNNSDISPRVLDHNSSPSPHPNNSDITLLVNNSSLLPHPNASDVTLTVRNHNASSEKVSPSDVTHVVQNSNVSLLLQGQNSPGSLLSNPQPESFPGSFAEQSTLYNRSAHASLSVTPVDDAFDLTSIPGLLPGPSKILHQTSAANIPTPIANIPQTYAEDTPITPITNMPQTYAENTPITPIANMPQTYAGNTSITPVANIPQTYAGNTPITPVANIAQTYAGNTPIAPVKDTPITHVEESVVTESESIKDSVIPEMSSRAQWPYIDRNKRYPVKRNLRVVRREPASMGPIESNPRSLSGPTDHSYRTSFSENNIQATPIQ